MRGPPHTHRDDGHSRNCMGCAYEQGRRESWMTVVVQLGVLALLAYIAFLGLG